MALIEVKQVSKNYLQGEITVHALGDISFEIEQGEFTAIVGPSGSGKTTALNLIGALDDPTAGNIKIGGQTLSGLNEKEKTRFRLHNLGFVFQFYNLLPVFTALENVEYPLLLLGIPKKERRERSFALLEEMGIGELKNRLPREMSGGQQQRVSVARALVSNPKVVLADEPTANLDWESADRLLDIMETMCEKKKVTFLFSTHDQRVMKRAKRLIKLRDGQIQRME